MPPTQFTQAPSQAVILRRLQTEHGRELAWSIFAQDLLEHFDEFDLEQAQSRALLKSQTLTGFYSLKLVDGWWRVPGGQAFVSAEQRGRAGSVFERVKLSMLSNYQAFARSASWV